MGESYAQPQESIACFSSCVVPVSAIAIVGGAGFIGRRLSTILQDTGHDVRVIDVQPPPTTTVDYRYGDVRDRHALNAALTGFDVVYNLAAVHRDDVKTLTMYDSVNVTGATNVCAACRDQGITRLIFTSSVAVYGNADTDVGEQQPPAPTTPYGTSKLRAEQIHRAWQAEVPRVRSLVIVRPTVVFSEGNRGNVYNLVRQIASGRFLMVGSGRNQKSMAYVGNVVAFLARMLTADSGTHLFNYVDKPDPTMHELVSIVLDVVGQPRAGRKSVPFAMGYLAGLGCDIVSAVTGKNLPISAARVRKFCSTTTFSATRLSSTGFQPPVGLRDALVQTIRHEVEDL